MKDYYQKESDQDVSGTIKAQLYIYIDAETNNINFATDWEDDNNGEDAIARIFYELKHKDLIEQILMVLYKQCVVEDRVDVFNKILRNLYSKVLDNTDPDKLVVRPTAQGAKYV